ncbi:MAG: lipopolysaccharide assembly protein LapB [Candidatus Berkiella sp.]
MLELICLLLPIAAVSGWYIGRRSETDNASSDGKPLSPDYYAGLNFLLNEQTDKAVDAFIRMLDESPDSVETMIALGNFFRRRGEVDRAIRIHQSLLSKSSLTSKQRSRTLFELASNYLRAGVLDRAEALLLEITNSFTEDLDHSLRHLMDIYEREKEWEKAIAVAKRLEASCGQSCGKEIAQYYCELAESVWSKGKIRIAFNLLKQALRFDKHCARASLIEGNFYKKIDKYKQALHAYQRIEYQDVAFLPEALVMIQECYERLGEQEALSDYLEYLMQNCPSITIVLANAEQVKDKQGKEHAAAFLTRHMHKYPSMRGLKHLIEFHLSRVMGEVRNELLMLKSLVEQLIEKKPVYRCGGCGFASRSLHWQCPSCRQWAGVKPIQGIEGE